MFNWTRILFSRQKYLVQMIISAIDLEYLKYFIKRTNFFLLLLVQLNVNANQHFQQKNCSKGLIFFSVNISAIEH